MTPLKKGTRIYFCHTFIKIETNYRRRSHCVTYFPKWNKKKNRSVTLRDPIVNGKLFDAFAFGKNLPKPVSKIFFWLIVDRRRFDVVNKLLTLYKEPFFHRRRRKIWFFFLWFAFWTLSNNSATRFLSIDYGRQTVVDIERKFEENFFFVLIL